MEAGRGGCCWSTSLYWLLFFISWQGKGLFCIIFQGHTVNDIGKSMHVRYRGRRWKQLIALNPHSGSKERSMLVLSAGSRFVRSGPQPVDWHSQRLFTLANNRNPSSCSSTNEYGWWRVGVCVYEYYSVLEKIVITKFAWKWMVLECLLLSEAIQSQKEKNCMVLLVCNTKPIMCVCL